MSKRNLLVTCATVTALASLLILARSGRTQSKAPPEFRFQYATKFLCTATGPPGTSGENPQFLPGIYRTLVNIHNPNAEPARIRQKYAATSLEPSRFFRVRVEPDFVAGVDCTQLERKFGVIPIHGTEGYLVIESTHSLDVTALHMAGKHGEDVGSIDVVQVRERVIG